MEHGGAAGGDVPKLDTEFLAFYDEATSGKPKPKLHMFEKPQPILVPAQMPFVGDAQDWKYNKNTADAAQEIADSSRVYLPSEKIARIWGEAEKE